MLSLRNQVLRQEGVNSVLIRGGEGNLSGGVRGAYHGGWRGILIRGERGNLLGVVRRAYQDGDEEYSLFCPPL